MNRHNWPAQNLKLKWFRPSEFERVNGHPEKMDAEFLKRLDRLRNEAGVALVVTDAYRTPEEVRSIYGEDEDDWPFWLREYGSPHERGVAVDVKPIGGITKKMRVVRTVLNLWAEGEWPDLGLGIYDRHLHLDADADSGLTRPRMWHGESK